MQPLFLSLADVKPWLEGFFDIIWLCNGEILQHEEQQQHLELFVQKGVWIPRDVLHFHKYLT